MCVCVCNQLTPMFNVRISVKFKLAVGLSASFSLTSGPTFDPADSPSVGTLFRVVFTCVNKVVMHLFLSAEHPAQKIRSLEGDLHPQLSEEWRDAGGGAQRHGPGRGSRWAALIRPCRRLLPLLPWFLYLPVALHCVLSAVIKSLKQTFPSA